MIEKGHDYHFIGKVGQFCPMKDGYGAGLLMREKDGRYYAATGSKGYRWMESDKPYIIRFGISMLMRHYLDEGFKQEYPEKVAAIRSEEYYVNMMRAWYCYSAGKTV